MHDDDLLLERAALLRRAPESSRPSDEAETVRFLVVTVAGERLGLPLAALREVARSAGRRPTPIPGTPDVIAGVVILRGRVVDVVATARLLGLEGPVGGPVEEAVVVCAAGDDAFGFLVDDVGEIHDFDRGAIGEDLDGVAPRAARFLSGVARRGEELVALIEPERVLAAEELAPFRGRLP